MSQIPLNKGVYICYHVLNFHLYFFLEWNKNIYSSVLKVNTVMCWNSNRQWFSTKMTPKHSFLRWTLYSRKSNNRNWVLVTNLLFPVTQVPMTKWRRHHQVETVSEFHQISHCFNLCLSVHRCFCFGFNEIHM